MIGALIGGGASLGGGWLQHRLQTKSDQAKELRKRQEDAAQKCHQILGDMEKILDDNLDAQFQGWRGVVNLSELLLSHYRDFSGSALLLPRPWHDRLHECIRISQVAWEIKARKDGEPGWHYHSDFRIHQNSFLEARKLLAAFLQGGPPPKTTAVMVEYLAAVNNLEKDRRRRFKTMFELEEESREQFLIDNPNVARETE